MTVIRGNRRRPSGLCAMPAADDLVRRRHRDVAPLEADAALAGAVEPVDRAKRRRLARAVGADQRHDLACADPERDALERVDRAVVEVDVVQLEDVAGGRLGAHAAAPLPR